MIVKKTKKHFSRKVTKRNQRGGAIKAPVSETPKTKNKYQKMSNFDLYKKLETRGLRSLFGRMKARKELTLRRKELESSEPVNPSIFSPYRTTELSLKKEANAATARIQDIRQARKYLSRHGDFSGRPEMVSNEAIRTYLLIKNKE
jgi:hypothetical protein